MIKLSIYCYSVCSCVSTSYFVGIEFMNGGVSKVIAGSQSKTTRMSTNDRKRSRMSTDEVPPWAQHMMSLVEEMYEVMKLKNHDPSATVSLGGRGSVSTNYTVGRGFDGSLQTNISRKTMKQYISYVSIHVL